MNVAEEVERQMEYMAELRRRFAQAARQKEALAALNMDKIKTICENHICDYCGRGCDIDRVLEVINETDYKPKYIIKTYPCGNVPPEYQERIGKAEKKLMEGIAKALMEHGFEKEAE